VTDVVGIPAIRVGGVEQGDAGVKSGVQHTNREVVVAIGRRREAHAAHANHEEIADCRLQIADCFRLKNADCRFSAFGFQLRAANIELLTLDPGP
jgi:hypothetical protein